MRRLASIVGSGLLLAGCTASPLGLLDEASNAASQTVCDAAFVSHVSTDDALAKELLPEPGMGAVAWALSTDIDRDKGEVRSTIAGGFRSRSVYRRGRGCTLVFGGALPTPLKPPPASAPQLGAIAGPAPVETGDPALKAAVDAAFVETTPPRATAAVIVVQDGRIVAERYAKGYGIGTQLSGHSIAKSVVNALLGILAREGRIDIAARAPVPQWRSDPRQAITIEDLMRMRAGFGWDEGTGAGLATHMWYTQADTAAFAAQAKLLTPPGRAWGYSSRGYQILSRILGETIGGGPQGVADFAARELFAPLGMRDVTIQFDQAGTMMGAWSVFASPRDWARFGLLYLNDGAIGTTRILPQGWVKMSTTPTLDAGYGAGFWLNNTDTPVPSKPFAWGIPGAPRDAFMARGYMGQYIVIVPSQKLVVVRMGFAHGPGADIDGVGRLVRDVTLALQAGHAGP
jgi:CubicO group peptidase (beta-lactamase class C family)